MQNQYFKSKENYNSNNYDLILYSEIPPNIKKSGPEDILKEVNELMPLTKKTHLFLRKKNISHIFKYIIQTKVNIHMKSKN